tara:strand:- start:244 stop:915 length:672 start_codon:yes stop_codon:yes gene_type:complete
MKEVIIIGEGKISEELYYYIENDSEHNVVAFSVEKQFIRNESKFDLPVVPFEEINRIYPPDSHSVIVAMGYQNLNGLRTRMYKSAKEKGYGFINYISSKILNAGKIPFGENCIIMENNTINATAKIGNNVILWSGNHIGHHSIIEDNCFLAGQVVVSGVTTIGQSSFIGVNSTIGHQIKIGERNLIGARSLITKNTKPNSVYIEQDTEKYRLDSDSFLKLTKL